MTAEAIRINGRNADQKRERNGADCDAADERFGKTKLPAQKAVNCGAD